VQRLSVGQTPSAHHRLVDLGHALDCQPGSAPRSEYRASFLGSGANEDGARFVGQSQGGDDLGFGQTADRLVQDDRRIARDVRVDSVLVGEQLDGPVDATWRPQCLLDGAFGGVDAGRAGQPAGQLPSQRRELLGRQRPPILDPVRTVYALDDRELAAVLGGESRSAIWQAPAALGPLESFMQGARITKVDENAKEKPGVGPRPRHRDS
jgi:hypothetical protein